MVNRKIVKSNAAIDAARKLLDNPKLAASELAQEIGVDRDTIGAARLILTYGTAQQLSDITTGLRGIMPIAAEIKAKMTPAERAEIKKRAGTFTENRREKLLG